MKKICNTCNKEKDIEDFGKNSRAKSGRRNTCKKCLSDYMKEYYKKNPDKLDTNRSKQALRDAGKNRFTRHKITIGEYDEMVARFDGKCWSCKDRSAFVIDHDHNCCPKQYSCGECIRGVLCSQCNTALGLLSENPEFIMRLLQYSQTTY